MSDARLGIRARVMRVAWVPVFLLVLFSVIGGGKFLSWTNLTSILQQSIAPSVIVWGLCFVLTMWVIDLSPGVTIILGGMVGTVLGVEFGYVGFWVGAVAVGVVVGLINGFTFLALRIPSIIVTVGVVMVLEVVSSLFSGGQGIYLPKQLIAFGTFPANLIVWIVAFVLAYFLFNKTVVGAHIRAVGSSEQTATSVGLKAGRAKLLGFVLCSLFAGIGAVMYQSYGRYVEPQVSINSLALIFPPLAGFFYALSISRWVNLIIAVVIGELTIMMLLNGLIIAGVPSTWQQVALGAVLIAVMAISARGSTAVVK